MDNRTDVAIIVGSASDLPVINETVKMLKEFGLAYSINIASAHRTTQHLKQSIQGAESSGAKVFITAAGMAAALPGVVASETIVPVIGVPMEGKNLASLDALFAIVQMPKGVPVATVAVGKAGAVNAAVLAAQIIAVSNDALKEKLVEYKKKQAESVVKEDLKLQKDGIEKYLQQQAGK
ncbi:5-(carboxyamino)imidazole ribonucleotide mutase [Endomicrobium proavitum]|uniref:N5-carboxyaminoimidazole ribonucleotide mutase n=1 Tax=Endomicrobium proavitum TaxID=1408281 RepID=A0A0G3WJI2_9BACT|nr:5-(carboxyamino)imidazole ribonucleotide mutase [Endomicrobium proavitum]AKL98017.1 N5-carboxyaminoimidazole ribonucleotide mutase [Endomicrobium proavitum]